MLNSDSADLLAASQARDVDGARAEYPDSAWGLAAPGRADRRICTTPAGDWQGSFHFCFHRGTDSESRVRVTNEKVLGKRICDSHLSSAMMVIPGSIAPG